MTHSRTDAVVKSKAGPDGRTSRGSGKAPRLSGRCLAKQKKAPISQSSF